MLKTSQYSIRGFHILADAQGKYKPLDAICQFEYKNHQVSISTAGLSQGACQSEVFVFGGENRDDELHRAHSVEEAIKFIDDLNKD